jgi:hypothetical protein
MLVPLTDSNNPYAAMMLALIDDQRSRSRSRCIARPRPRTPSGLVASAGWLLGAAVVGGIVGVAAASSAAADTRSVGA